MNWENNADFQRPIVEFAVENRRALQIKANRLESGKAGQAKGKAEKS